MSYFTRNMDKCSRLHSFPVTRYVYYHSMYTIRVGNKETLIRLLDTGSIIYVGIPLKARAI